MKTAPRPPLPAAWALPALVCALYGALALTSDLRLTAVLPAVALAALSLLAVVLYAGERGLVPWGAGTVLGVAAAVRLLFLFRPPELSDDVYRYLWDGLQTLSGHSPYALAPAAAPAPSAAFLGLRARVNHPDLVTLYPPAAQLVFAAGASLGGTVTALKGLLTVLDLGSCALLLLVLANLGLPAPLAALYAWHPLAVLEVAGSGHVDGAGVFFLLACVALLTRRGSRAPSRAGGFAAGVLFALACLTKLFPLVFAPQMLAAAGRRRAPPFAAGFALAGGLVTVPFLPSLAAGVATLGLYAQTWEFSGFAFQIVRTFTGSGLTARLVLGTAFAAVWGCTCWGRRDTSASTERAPFHAMYAVALAFLFLTPTLHPWYALYLAALLPLAAEPAGLVLTGAVFLSYRVLVLYTLSGRWVEWQTVTAAVFAAGAAAWGLGKRAGRGVR